MPVTSLSTSSAPGSSTSVALAAPPAHPVLTTLRAALETIDHLEGCLSSFSLAAATSSETTEATNAKTPAAAAVSSGISVLAGEYERYWEALTKQLCLMVDQTHPDGERWSAEATHALAKSRQLAQDGRAVMLAWNASQLALHSADTTASNAQQQCEQHGHENGDVTRLFSFLQRLAKHVLDSDAAFTSTNTTPAAAAPSSKASTASSCTSTAKLFPKTKVQLQAEDIVGPVLIYGCAVASNLASFVAEGQRNKNRSNSGTSGNVVHAGVKSASARRVADGKERISLLGNTIWSFVVAVTLLYRGEKRILHLLLSVLSNLGSWPAVKIDADTCGFLYQLVTPFHTSYSIVAAWVTMLCNLTAVHAAATVPTLLRLGVVSDVQRLSLVVPPSESSTTERLVVHSVQLLSNVALYVFKDEETAKV